MPPVQSRKMSSVTGGIVSSEASCGRTESLRRRTCIGSTMAAFGVEALTATEVRHGSRFKIEACTSAGRHVGMTTCSMERRAALRHRLQTSETERSRGRSRMKL